MMNELLSKTRPPVKQQESRTGSNECKICGAPARYSYFGVISCQSCKMFFKRNAEQGQKVLICHFNNHCTVNITNRNVCSSCRLTKCLADGMQTELIRSSQSKTKRRNRRNKSLTNTTLAKCNEHEQFPTLNILGSDRSALNIDQWHLLSNLVQCFDEFNGLLLAEHFLCEQNTLPLKIRFKSSSVQKLIASIFKESRSLFEKNPDFLSLCSHDRSTLLHYSTKYITTLSTSFVGRQTGLLNYPAFLQSTETLVGSTTITIIKHLIDRLDFDITFIKIVLLILSFSTTNYTIYNNNDPIYFKDTKPIIQIHDRYVELAWRYLLYKYDHYQAVKHYSKLLSCLFTLNTILVQLHEEQNFTNIIDVVINQTKQTLDHKN